MEKGILMTDMRQFSAASVPAAMELANFTANNNAWSVVTGVHLETSQPNDPFLISRNLNETALIDWAGNKRMAFQNIGARGSRSEYLTPFAEEFLVVINMGGGGTVLSRKDMFWHNLNPNARTHTVLEPSHPSGQTLPNDTDEF